MLRGLSAFPLTPFTGGAFDEVAFGRLVERLAASGVDSIGALGSTGAYAYLTRDERRRAAATAVGAAGAVPVLIGVGAVSTREVLTHVADAEAAGAAAVLLAPLAYHPLTEGEVLGLYEEVTATSALPVVIYDNRSVTGFEFTFSLLIRIAQLPNITSIKLDGVPETFEEAQALIARLRAGIPSTVTIGVSTDAVCTRGLLAGGDTWYSVLAGILPVTCRAITDAALAGDIERATGLTSELQPVWDLFDRYGSHRTASAIAVERGLFTEESIHRPLRPIDRVAVRAALQTIGPRS